MIVTRTPFRMSFFGGGTDLEAYFRENGGAVLSTTFNRYCYVTLRHLPRFHDYSTELDYYKTERITDVEQIEHPMIRNAMKMTSMKDIRLVYDADLPARSGLGTSSSFAVSMLSAFHAYRQEPMSKRMLAEEAILLERVLCNEAGGWQDQVAAAYGGLNRIEFGKDGFEVYPVCMDPERKKQLNDNLMLFFTGKTRLSYIIHEKNAGKHIENRSILKQMHAMVYDAESILIDSKQNLDDFGVLLNETWQLKRQTNSAISTDSIDALYLKARQAGALGGKLLGAGGGGFLLLYVQPEYQAKVRQELSSLMRIPFQFENKGYEVLFQTPEFCAE